MVKTNQPNRDSDLDLRATLDAHNIRQHISATHSPGGDLHYLDLLTEGVGSIK